MNLFDSHLHLNHPEFFGREEQVWREANQAGVREGVIIGYDLAASRRAVELAETLPGLSASVGVSPHDIMAAPGGYIEELRTMAGHPRVAAIGECGLEYHYPAGPREIQIEQFLHQSRLARELGKILVIHLREADRDFLQILNDEPPASAILHCFTASAAVLDAAVERGYYISFSGILTFKNARDLQEIALRVPDERYLIETDAPYLAPIPYRGQTCEPKMIGETARKLAELRKTDVEEIAGQSRTNAYKAFSIQEGNDREN